MGGRLEKYVISPFMYTSIVVPQNRGIHEMISVAIKLLFLKPKQ